MVTPHKNKKVPVALMNTNTYNVWIRQPLLVANIVEAEDCPWDHQSSMSHDGNKINISFCPVPSTEVQAEIAAVSVTTAEPGKKLEMTLEGGERPKFGSQPDFNWKFDFKKELSQLPFPVNMGDMEMTESQHKKFIELIYNHQSVFLLCDEDLGLYDHLKHTIPTTMDQPIYLPHCTILVQLQVEVCKCLDTWLKQGIIWPSQSPYTLQVVIVHKKTGDICLCMDFRALNAITIHNSFPLRRIEEALQAVKVAVWSTSFDLAQGYLQLAMNEADIHKTAFHAGSSGLYEFTHMPFGLSNVGASFFHLMEMCLGDQQFLMLLFYLDEICIFGSFVDEMLDRITMVLQHLKDFNLKIKPKKLFFFQLNVLFLGHMLSKDGILPNTEKVSKVKNWPILKMERKFILSLD